MRLLRAGSPATSSSSLLLVWSAVAALLPVAAAQAVAGLSTGINNATGERPARININDLYNEAGPHW